MTRQMIKIAYKAKENTIKTRKNWNKHKSTQGKTKS